MKSSMGIASETSPLTDDENFSGDEDVQPLRCWDCNVNFTSRDFLNSHLFHHIKQPQVSLTRIQLPPLKLTIKNTSNNFEVVQSPTGGDTPTSGGTTPQNLPISEPKSNLAENEEGVGDEQQNAGGLEQIEEESKDLPGDLHEDTSLQDLEGIEGLEGIVEEAIEDDADVSFSPNFANVDIATDSPNAEDSCGGDTSKKISEVTDEEAPEYGSVPGAEPTPPPEPSPESYPKIRIKTTGLLKEPTETLTITEITDDNPDGENNEGNSNSGQRSSLWNNLEDPLKLPDDSNLLSLFNNNERAKDLGFTTSDSEFISLDRLDERNRNALQLYNPPSISQNNPLSSLTGLPMEALAQQVSRLQPSGNGMHQQNVLINIQQFPQVPPPQPYQPPPMYHHPPQPMYHQPYPYQPPNPMYYPPTPGYPQHMPPPPQPQMGQMGQPPMSQAQMVQQPQLGPPVSQPQSINAVQQQAYRQPIAPRQAGPRPMQVQGGPRGPMGPRQPMVQPRQPMQRQRAPIMRPRGGGGMSAVRSIRPRMPMPQNGQVRMGHSPIKRSPEQMQALQAKKKRFDVLTPDKDDEDCQVICMQPKNTDGGLPQIQSVQGGTAEPSESSVMHLSDSITLSVRNPQPRPQSPKKSDAKAVANILATRGITVTATPKPKEAKSDPTKAGQNINAALNLNGAVSIIPSAKNANNKSPSNSSPESNLPTVDLTDDTAPQMKQVNAAQKPNQQRQGLPFRCDLCPAQYPNAISLSKHRQNYHKTAGGMCEIGVPLINLKQPGIFQKLSSLGIFSYIPLPSSGPDGMFALPIINSRNPGNVASMGASQMLTLGPVRNIPRPQNNVANSPQNGPKPMAQASK